MKLKEIMTHSVKTVRPDATVQQAAETMRVIDAGSLPVSDGDRIVGILTDRDIVTRSTAQGRDPMLAKVREVMSRDIVYAYEDQDVEEATRLMERKKIRRLVVLDRERHLAGFVSLGDVCTMTHDRRLAGQVLERVSERPPGQMLH